MLERAESILSEGPPVWDRLDQDYLAPSDEKPKTSGAETVYVEEHREPPRRTGGGEAFKWDFKK